MSNTNIGNNTSITGNTSNTSSNDQSSDSQENTTQLLNDIQSLQTIEQQLFSSLEENTGLTTDQQKKVIEKINNISNMRINLYQTLNNINSFFQNNLANSKGILTEQTAAIDIVEKELNTSKKRLQLLEEEKNNKIRLVEINNYYGQKYAEHSELMKIIVIMLFLILIITILLKKGILPNQIYYILLVIISIIGGIYIWKIVFSIVLRDPMNYEEYDWYFNQNNAPIASITDSSDSSDPWASKSNSSNLGSCIGDACCSDGLTYDSGLNQCVTSSSSNTNSNSKSNTNSGSNSGSKSNTNSGSNSNKHTTTETFINNIFTQPSKIFKKPDVILGSDNIQSNNSKSFINNSKF